MAQWEIELEELMVRRGRALVGYGYTLCRDRGRAEDLVQDALVKVFSRLRRPRGMADAGGQVMDLDQPQLTNAEAYVRRAMLTIYLDGYRRQTSWTGIKHLLADESSAPAAERVATARVDVGVALARLSPRQRESVVLRFFEDLTVPQIAERLGTSPGTIKRHLANAMELLRGSLAEMSAPEVDTALDERLDAVSGAVRRRRTAKIGAIGGVSAVAVVLAATALWGRGPFLSEPVLPATPSPAVSSAAVGAGWVPGGWQGKGDQFFCGMEVTELVPTSDVIQLELTGGVGEGEYGLTAPIRITRDDTEGLDVGGSYPQLIFARDGQVVDLGGGWNEGGYELPDAGGSADGEAEASATTACGEWTTGMIFETYLEARPAGTYDVYAVLPWADYTANDGTTYMAVSEPVTMEVPELEVPDEAPLTVDIRDGYQPEWLDGTDLVCGAHADAIPAGPQLPFVRSGLRLGADAGESMAPDQTTITFTETAGRPVDTTRTPFTLVWMSEGRVVGLGRDVWSEPAERLRVDPKGETSVDVPIEPDTTCLTDPAAGLPDGSYQVYAMTELDPGSEGEPQSLAVQAVYDYFIEP